MNFITYTQDIITPRQESHAILNTLKKVHSLFTTILKLNASKLVVMDDSKVDSDGYTESIRRHIVDIAVNRIRAKGIEPRVGLMLLYDQYVTGEMDREELQVQVQNRLANLITHLPYLDENRGNSELPNSYK